MATGTTPESDLAPITSKAGADGVGSENNDGEFYRRVLESLAEGVVITDAQWRILYANRLIERATGYPPEELVGLSLHQALVANNSVRRSECENLDPLPEAEQNAELEIKTKSGQPRWVTIKTTPFRNSEGQVVGRVAALSCIEKQKALE